MAGQTKAQVERDRDLAQGEAARLRAETETLRAQLTAAQGGKRMVPVEDVIRLARKAKRENGWCDDGFDDAMSELGIDPEETKAVYEVEVTLTLTVNADEFEFETETDQSEEDAVKAELESEEFRVGSYYSTRDGVEVEEKTVTKITRVGSDA